MIIMMACLFYLDLHAEIPRHFQLNTYIVLVQYIVVNGHADTVVSWGNGIKAS